MNYVSLSPSSRSALSVYNPEMISRKVSIKVEKMQTPIIKIAHVRSRSLLLFGLKSPKPTVEREVKA
jgi:hypothetical protein